MVPHAPRSGSLVSLVLYGRRATLGCDVCATSAFAAPHRDVFLIGVVAYIVALAVKSWFWCGLALHADRLELAPARAILDVAVMSGPVFTGTTMMMMAPVTLLALKSRVGLPRWLEHSGCGRSR